MHLQLNVSSASVTLLMAVFLVALVSTVVSACGQDSLPVAQSPTAVVLGEPPSPSPLPDDDEATQVSPVIVTNNGGFDEDSLDVVTEDDLLNTTHPLEDGPAPELTGIESWVGSGPVTLASLRGNIVLIDFWTYSCINCIRTLPFILEWQDKYGPLGLRVIGVHTPEFEFEKDIENVKAAVDRLEITYPVALDNDAETWDAFGVQAWPAKYLVDADGVIRYADVGEGGYVASGADDTPLVRTGRHRRLLSAFRAGRLPSRS